MDIHPPNYLNKRRQDRTIVTTHSQVKEHQDREWRINVK